MNSARSDAEAATGELQKAEGETRTVLGQAVEDLSKIWEKSEPVRAFIEKLHAPWDALGADVVLDQLIKKGESVAEAVANWTKEMPKQVDSWWSEVSTLAHDADSGLASWDDVAAAADSFTTKASAASAFTEQWAQDTKWVGPAAAAGDVASKVLGGTAIIGDISTILHPQDKGVMGKVDQGAALVNGGLVAANMFDEVPVAGQVIMIGTGVYLGGDYLYHHWQWFHNTCDTVGHAVSTAATSTVHTIGHAASSAWHAVTSLF